MQGIHDFLKIKSMVKTAGISDIYNLEIVNVC